MKTLVTGATGLVGSALTRQLVAHDADVRIFRRATSQLDLLGDVADRVEHAVGDVTAPDTVYRAMAGVDRVYQAAAVLGFGAGGRHAMLRRVNVGGTANVVNAALDAGVRRLVHTSSMAAFGRPDDTSRILDETSDWRAATDPSAYARSKYDAELEIHRGIAEGLDAVIVNPALVFGVGREGENTRQIVDAVRSGWMPGVPPGGTSVVDVLDVAEGHRRAMAHGATGERYFLGSENRSWRQIVDAFAAAFNVGPPRRELPAWLLRGTAAAAEAWATLTRTAPALTRDAAEAACRFHRYDNTKARTELGCTFRPFIKTAQRIAQSVR